MVTVSIQDLKQNPQDVSTFYLKKLYELQANPNGSHLSDVPSPPAFSPYGNSVLVNTLWLLSLVVSLICAMVATSMQQWARRYIKVTRPALCSPHKRARTRAFFANGIDKFQVPFVVEKLPSMVHLSLSLFFAGLLIYLYDINAAVFNAVAICVLVLSGLYTCFAVISVFWPDCPYRVPFSFPEWVLFVGIILAVYQHRGPLLWVIGLSSFTGLWACHFLIAHFLKSGNRSRNWILRDMEERVQEAVSRQSLEIDTHILDLTLDAMGEDGAQENFYESIPGFYKSDVVKDLRQRLPKELQLKIRHTLVGLFRRTLLSNSISRSVKFRRLAICIAAAEEMDTSVGSEDSFEDIIHQSWREMPHSIEFGEFLISWDRGRNGRYMQWIISNIVANERGRDDRWIALAMVHLGVTEHVLREYLAHGDSVILAILIHFIRYAIRSNYSSFRLLPPLSRIRIHHTLPALQHAFCALWNSLAQNPQRRSDPSLASPSVRVHILMATRYLYIALHRATGPTPTTFSAFNQEVHDIRHQQLSFQLHNIPCHHQDLTPHVHYASTGEISHTPTTTGMVPSLPRSESNPDDTTTPLADEYDESSHGDAPGQINRSLHAASTVPQSNPVISVNSGSTQLTQSTAVLSVVSTSGNLDPPHSTLPAPSVTGAPQRTENHFMRSSSVSPGTPISHSNVLPKDPQSCSTCAAPQSDQSIIIPQHSPNHGSIARLTARRGTSILDRHITLNVLELDPLEGSNPPTPTVGGHRTHPTTSDTAMTGELSSHLLDIAPHHVFGCPQ